MTAMRDRWLLLGLAAAAALAIAWRVDTSPLPEVTRFRDDAYYYFAWARSLAQGQGPCVTEGVPTNGVQPLWGLLLAASAWCCGPAALPLCAQVLGLALHALTALALLWVLRRHPIAAGCGALLYAGQPVLLTEAQNGQETALAALACVGLLGAWRAAEKWFALAAVAATLARSDLVLLVPFLAWSRHGARPRAAIAPAVALAVCFATNWLIAGRFWQDSAWPIPWLFAQHEKVAGGGVLDSLQRLWWWLRPCLLGSPFSEVSAVLAAVWVSESVRAVWPRLRLLPLAVVGAAWLLGASDLQVPAIAALLMALLPERAAVPGRSPLGPLLLGWMAIASLHFVIRHYPRSYYFAPMGALGVAALVALQARRPRGGAALALLVAVLQVLAARAPAPRREWQEETRMAGLYARDLVGDAEPLGCFNAGVIAFLHAGRVVNLDGVVNQEAFAALRAGALDAYLDREGVRFLIDVPVQFALRDAWPHASGRHFGSGFDPARDLHEIGRFDVPGVDEGVPGTDSVRLYQRVGRGPKLPAATTSRALGPSPDGGWYVLWARSGTASLSCIRPDGTTVELACGIGDAALVLKVPTPAPGRYILHAGDPSQPVVVLTVP